MSIRLCFIASHTRFSRHFRQNARIMSGFHDVFRIVSINRRSALARHKPITVFRGCRITKPFHLLDFFLILC